ncbi:hypothetical protein DPMN_137515 [Dreissena polymorpha]|uniref:Uncharacterized protein n=1 Tax=Dreissena polymorpha TaxID=45954 RepID=A0A9D4G1Z0_DREPO|nr:hypothetical protein DPMN_137515 [Dreissena polymorpha]
MQIFLITCHLIHGQEGVPVARGPVTDPVPLHQQSPLPDHVRTTYGRLEVAILSKFLVHE